MLMKLLVSVFERAKSKITSKASTSQYASDSDDEYDPNESKKNSSSVIHQQPRLSLSKWLCTTPTSAHKSISSSKSGKVRRSSSWRSLKERGNHYIGHFTSRTLSVDQLNRHERKISKTNSLNKRQSNRHDFIHTSMINSIDQRQKPSNHNRISLSNSDDASANLSVNLRNSDRSSCLNGKWLSLNKKHTCSTKLQRRNDQQNTLSRKNTNSGGGDSGYSEESFATTTLSSHIRPSHLSCPHCHCEQRSSFNYYKKSIETSSTDSSTSDTIMNKKQSPSESDYYYHQIFQHKQSLSASRSYPHIKPLPKSLNKSPIQQDKRAKTLGIRRRRHLSCDSSLSAKTKMQKSANLGLSPVIMSEVSQAPLQRHFTTIGMINCDTTSTYSKRLLKKNDVFGELNLAAIELDSIRTLDYHRPTYSSSPSTTSSSSSLNMEQQNRKKLNQKQISSKRKRIYLVWHEYRNSSLLSATNGEKLFSVIRGDQVRLLRRIGKSTLLVQKEDDGSIGFLPQSCLAHDQINSFLSVKGLKETVL